MCKYFFFIDFPPHRYGEYHDAFESCCWRRTQIRCALFTSRRKQSACVVLLLQFFSIVYTHFLKACLIFSELYTQIQKNTHNGQNPSILLQNETLHSKQCYFFSKWDFVFKWHTQTIICIDIYKNQLNTDVLNVKHYDECKTLLLHSS